MSEQDSAFVVTRVDRRGELAPTYLRAFALAGRNGVRQLGFGSRETAHLFEQRSEAEDVARRLRRRVSTAEHDYVVAEATEKAPASS